METELIPVFANFGACVFVAQNLECDIGTLLAAISASKKQAPDHAALEEIFSNKESESLGGMFHDLKSKEYITKKEETIFRIAIKQRNHLVHSFLSNNVLKFSTMNGRHELITEIQSIREQLEAAQAISCSLLDKYLEEYNLSTEKIVEIARKTFTCDYDNRQ